ncbi:hypothetical protein GCM10010498_20470 [Streptomyces cavourensis]|nr:hypothetical protein GCM10010498_20470 [Streptomyces cavourensis]
MKYAWSRRFPWSGRYCVTVRPGGSPPVPPTRSTTPNGPGIRVDSAVECVAPSGTPAAPPEPWLTSPFPEAADPDPARRPVPAHASGTAGAFPGRLPATPSGDAFLRA